MSDSQTFSTLDELIAHFRRPSDLAALLGISHQSLANAARRGALPARNHLVHRQILADRGLIALPAIWRVQVPDPAAAPAARKVGKGCGKAVEGKGNG